MKRFSFLIIWLIQTSFVFGQIQSRDYKIGVILNNVDITQASYSAIKKIISLRVKELNDNGGIGGKDIEVTYLNDSALGTYTKARVEGVLEDENLIALVGCWNSTRARGIIDIVGETGIPWLGDFAIIDPATKYPNILSLDKGISNEIEVFENFIKDYAKANNFRIGFIGRESDLYTQRFYYSLQKLIKENPNISLTVDRWYPQGYELGMNEMEKLNSEIENKTDFLIFSRGKENTSLFIDQFRQKQGRNTPIMTILAPLGPVLSSLSSHSSQGELFDINVVGIPNALNLRFQEQINVIRKEDTDFDIDPLGIGYAGKYSDAIAMLVDAANARPEKMGVKEGIVEQLQQYTNNQRYYNGWFANYSFNEDGSRSGDVLLVWKPKSSDSYILAPIQYLNQGLKRAIPTAVLYTNIDMIDIDHVDDIEETFRANFYLEITSKTEVEISDIKFSNAARSEGDYEALVETDVLDTGWKNDEYYLLAKVSGKFYFSPQHERYPFDEQKLSIYIQAANSLNPFLIQPPNELLRDKNYETTNWTKVVDYVGFRNDFINSVTSFGNTTQVLPVYSFSFSYVLKRGRVDFYRKIIIPIFIMLVIIYTTSFIRVSFFGAISGIQVTCFLACVALYYSVYKPSNETSTISDNIFIASYLIITSMTIASVIRLYYQNNKPQRAFLTLINKLAIIYQKVAFPILMLVSLVILFYVL